MTDLGAILLVILTAIYWLKKNKELIIWRKKLEAYEKIILCLHNLKWVFLIFSFIEEIPRNDEKRFGSEENLANLIDKNTRHQQEHIKSLNQIRDTQSLLVTQKTIEILKLCSVDPCNPDFDYEEARLNTKHFLELLIYEAREDLETTQPSFTRSMKHIWRDIKLFCR